MPTALRPSAVGTPLIDPEAAGGQERAGVLADRDDAGVECRVSPYEESSFGELPGVWRLNCVVPGGARHAAIILIG